MQTARCPQSTRGHCMSVSPTQSRERVKGRSSLWGQGATPIGFPQSTRGHCMSVSPTQSRERVKGRSPLWGQGAKPLGDPQSTRGHSLKVSPTQSRGRVKGGTPLQGAGTASLLGSRGNAPWVSPRSLLHTIVTIATAVQGKCEFAVTSGAKRLRAGKKRAIIENEKAR